MRLFLRVKNLGISITGMHILNKKPHSIIFSLADRQTDRHWLNRFSFGFWSIIFVHVHTSNIANISHTLPTYDKSKYTFFSILEISRQLFEISYNFSKVQSALYIEIFRIGYSEAGSQNCLLSANGGKIF